MSTHPGEPEPFRILFPGIIGAAIGAAFGSAGRGAKEPTLDAVLQGLRGHTTAVLEQLQPLLTELYATRVVETSPVLDVHISDASAGRCGTTLLALEQRYLIAAALFALHGFGQSPEDVQLREVLSKHEVQKLPLSQGLHEVSKVVGDLEVVQATAGSLDVTVRPRRPKHRRKPDSPSSADWWARVLATLNIVATLAAPSLGPDANQPAPPSPPPYCTVFIIENGEDSTETEVPRPPDDDLPKVVKKVLDQRPEHVNLTIVVGRRIDDGDQGDGDESGSSLGAS